MRSLRKRDSVQSDALSRQSQLVGGEEPLPTARLGLGEVRQHEEGNDGGNGGAGALENEQPLPSFEACDAG